MVEIDGSIKRLQLLAYLAIAAGLGGLLLSLYGRMQTGRFDYAAVMPELGIALLGVFASMISKSLGRLEKRLNALSPTSGSSKSTPP